MDDLTLNNMALILSADMDADLLIETHMKYDKILILRKKATQGPIRKKVIEGPI